MNQPPKPRKISRRTAMIRAGLETDPLHGAVMPPLYLTTNFSFEGYGRKRAYDYTRTGHPTRDVLGDTLAQLEGGAGGVITGSGMSAIHLLLHILGPEDLLLAPHDCYGGTYRLLSAMAERGRFRLEYRNLTDTSRLPEYFASGPRMVLVEPVSNPLLRVTDLRAIVAEAQKAGCLVAADSTFLSPVLLRPLEFGADFVLHSTTKYLNGHGDIVGGAVISKTPEHHERMSWWANCIGVTASPLDCFLTLRGVRTLEVRIRQQEESAGILARSLEDRPEILRVRYPGLASHEGHAIADRQQNGFGAMLSFELDTQAIDTGAFLESLELFTLAESLGGFESLVAHPASMTHAAMSAEARATAGISDGLIRLSVGLEDPDDLRADLVRSLDQARI